MKVRAAASTRDAGVMRDGKYQRQFDVPGHSALRQSNAVGGFLRVSPGSLETSPFASAKISHGR